MSEGYSAGSIEVLRGAEHVRRRPGMYVGSTGPSGIGHLLNELVSNSADQFLMGLATRCRVQVAHTAAGWEYTVEDDGSGLPFDLEQEGCSYAELYLTTLHFTPTRDGHAPHVHRTGMHGLGLCVTAALCSEFEVVSWRAGRRWRVLLRAGQVAEGPTSTTDPDGRGTWVRAVADPSLFKDTKPDLGDLRARLLRGAHLFGGWKVEFQDERFHAPGGLRDLAALLAESPDWEPVHVQWRDDRLCGEVVLWGRADRPRVLSWCNGEATRLGGSHEHGLRRALATLGREPDLALIHVIFQEPAYAGPTRDRLEVPWVAEEVARHVMWGRG